MRALFVAIFLLSTTSTALKRRRYLYEVQARLLTKTTSSPTSLNDMTASDEPVESPSETVTVFQTLESTVFPTLQNTQPPTDGPSAKTRAPLQSSSGHSPSLAPSTQEVMPELPVDPAIQINWSVIVPLLSLGLMAWSVGKNKRNLCCVDIMGDAIPDEIIVSMDDHDVPVAGDDATDIELVPVETFESWTGSAEYSEGESSSYVRML